MNIILSLLPQSHVRLSSRLRTVLKDPELVDEAGLKNETQASGVVVKGNNVQVVYGVQVGSIRKSVDEVLGFSSKD